MIKLNYISSTTSPPWGEMIKLNYISSTTSPPWGRDDKIKLHILHYQPSLGER